MLAVVDYCVAREEATLQDNATERGRAGTDALAPEVCWLLLATVLQGGPANGRSLTTRKPHASSGLSTCWKQLRSRWNIHRRGTPARHILMGMQISSIPKEEGTLAGKNKDKYLFVTTEEGAGECWLLLASALQGRRKQALQDDEAEGYRTAADTLAPQRMLDAAGYCVARQACKRKELDDKQAQTPPAHLLEQVVGHPPVGTYFKNAVPCNQKWLIKLHRVLQNDSPTSISGENIR